MGRKLLVLTAIDRAFREQRIGWSKVLLLAKVVAPEHEAGWLDRALCLTCRELALEVQLSKPGRPPRGAGDRKGLPEVRFKVQASVGVLTHQKLELAKAKLSAERGGPVTDAECLDVLAELLLSTEEDGTVPGRTRVSSSLYKIVLRPAEGGGRRDGRRPAATATGGGVVRDGGGGGQGDATSGGARTLLRRRRAWSSPGGQRTRPGADRRVRGGPARRRASAATASAATPPSAVHDDARAGSAPEEDGDSTRQTPAWLRRRVLARDGQRCRCCGSRHRLMVHHVRYRSHHGPTRASNLIGLCVIRHSLVHANLLVLEGEDAEHVRFLDLRDGPCTNQACRSTPRGSSRSPPPRRSAESPAPAQPTPPPVTLDAAAGDRGSGVVAQDRAPRPLPRRPGARVGGGDAPPRGRRRRRGRRPHPDGAPSASPPPIAPPVPVAEAFAGIVGQDRAAPSTCGRDSRGAGPAGGPSRTPSSWVPPAPARRPSLAAWPPPSARASSPRPGPSSRTPTSLLRLLADLRPGDVLFLDEVHAVPRPVLETLYEAMTDRRISLTLHAGARARAVTLAISPPSRSSRPRPRTETCPRRSGVASA